MEIKRKMRLGDALLKAKIITEEQLMAALEIQKNNDPKPRLGDVLVEMGAVTDETIAKAITQQLGMEFVDLRGFIFGEDIIKLVSNELLRKHTVMPLEYNKYSLNTLRLAMADPMDMLAMDDISLVTGLQIEPVVAVKSDILHAIDKIYGNSEAMDVAQQYVQERGFDGEVDRGEQMSDDVSNSPIVLLVKTMIEQGVRQRASDIHIEAMEKQVRVRYRIDGELYERMTYDVRLLSAIVARIKIIGGMDISEKRKPQDGRITQVVDNMEFDIRVSVLPTVFGEKVVMRLTSKKALTRDKKMLGFSDDEMEKFDRILKHPHGIILVTGPTGSGKSTTLYTALSELNDESINIITVEDPVEANVDGINQVHVNPKANLTFASALRSILRQDPDIIMIGEIRDGETAGIAVKASITGHLVVSTLHTNSAASTITRLQDMGIEDYMIADSVVGIIAQRLVRRLCPDCKTAYEASESNKKLLGLPEEGAYTLYKPKGCPTCSETGYRGRIGVYEIMEVTKTLKKVISKGEPADVIQKQALEEGMYTLALAAGNLVKDGITSLSEMVRISMES